MSAPAYRTLDECDILSDILSALKIDDIYIVYDRAGLVAYDDYNVWTGEEFYRFLIEDAIVFEPDGSCLVISDSLMSKFRSLAQRYGVKCPPSIADVSTRSKGPVIFESKKDVENLAAQYGALHYNGVRYVLTHTPRPEYGYKKLCYVATAIADTERIDANGIVKTVCIKWLGREEYDPARPETGEPFDMAHPRSVEYIGEFYQLPSFAS